MMTTKTGLRYFPKGSPEAKRHMAKLRALAAKKRKANPLTADERALLEGRAQYAAKMERHMIKEKKYELAAHFGGKHDAYIDAKTSFNPRHRNPARPGQVDQHAATELRIFIDNDADLYRQQYQPIIKNLMIKRAKGIFNPELAVKLFMYLVDNGARKYIQQFGARGQRIDELFNRPTRLQVARELTQHFIVEADLGNYDQYLPKMTARQTARRGAGDVMTDLAMWEKGYRYKLVPASRKFEPLYAKTLADIGPLMREYPKEKFKTITLQPPRGNPKKRRAQYRIWVERHPTRRGYTVCSDPPLPGATGSCVGWYKYKNDALRRAEEYRRDLREHPPKQIPWRPPPPSRDPYARNPAALTGILKKGKKHKSGLYSLYIIVDDQGQEHKLLSMQWAPTLARLFGESTKGSYSDIIERVDKHIGERVTLPASNPGRRPKKESAEFKRMLEAAKNVGVQMVYSPVNQAWILMWHNQVLKIGSKAEVEAELRQLLKKENPLLPPFGIPPNPLTRHERTTLRIRSGLLRREAKYASRADRTFLLGRAREASMIARAPEIRNPPQVRGNPGAYFVIDTAEKLIGGFPSHEILSIHRGVPYGFKDAALAAEVAARKLGRNVYLVVHPYVPKGFKKGAFVTSLFMAMGYQLVGPGGILRKNPGRCNPEVCDNPKHRHPRSRRAADNAAASRKELEEAARACGLYVDTWSPGDGVTRYRFTTEPVDYFAAVSRNTVATVKGMKKAWKFVQEYCAGKGRQTQNNPRGRSGWNWIGWSRDKKIFAQIAELGGSTYPALSAAVFFHPSLPSRPRGGFRQASTRKGAQGLAYLKRWVSQAAGTQIQMRRAARYEVPRVHMDRLGWTSDNPKMTRAAREFISKKISIIAREGLRGRRVTQQQAIAAAHSMARAAGYKVPPPPKGNPLLLTVGNPRQNISRAPAFRDKQVVTVEQARAWGRAHGLSREVEEAIRLQTKANRPPTHFMFKRIPFGPSGQTMRTVLVHYGQAPETRYIPPKGSKKLDGKGPIVYRHRWGEKGRGRPVPVLVDPSGKVIVKVMGPGQKTGDWMRG